MPGHALSHLDHPAKLSYGPRSQCSECQEFHTDLVASVVDMPDSKVF